MISPFSARSLVRFPRQEKTPPRDGNRSQPIATDRYPSLPIATHRNRSLPMAANKRKKKKKNEKKNKKKREREKNTGVRGPDRCQSLRNASVAPPRPRILDI